MPAFPRVDDALMLRWMLLLFSLVCLGLMFLGPGTGWVLFGVAGFLFGSIATALAFAHARIDARARDEHVVHVELATQRPPPAASGSRDDHRPPVP